VNSSFTCTSPCDGFGTPFASSCPNAVSFHQLVGAEFTGGVSWRTLPSGIVQEPMKSSSSPTSLSYTVTVTVSNSS